MSILHGFYETRLVWHGPALRRLPVVSSVATENIDAIKLKVSQQRRVFILQRPLSTILTV